jgi:aspartyl-tRNA(Asn)/glutamyl-tRNA(Gln) amidotransferase subunit A
MPLHDEIAYFSALELKVRYTARSLSPVEVTRAVLERIEALNPVLTAFITVTPELALQQATAAEHAYASDEPGPLAGVPISIKDLTPTKGIRTTRGSLIYQDWIPDEDPPFVDRVYGAGAVMLGKTNTPEFGWKADSGNRLVGPTHNPWKHGKTAGGSSGGAGAAVAAGLGPLAQGSDGGGSIRIPASFCGIFGLKPSSGLVPQVPPSAFGDLSHLGPMTRTVRDAALLLNVVAGGDPRERYSWTSGIDYLAACEGGIQGLKIAWSPDLGYARLDPQVRDACTRAVQTFVKLGAEVEEVDPELPDPGPIWAKYWAAGSAATHGGDLERVRELIDPGRMDYINGGNSLSGVEVASLTIQRNAFWMAMCAFMERYDLLLTPTLSRTAFTAGDNGPTEIAGVPMKDAGEWSPFCHPINLTGQPAASVPVGFDRDGLPIGLQIVGRWHDDPTVLRAAAAFEAAAPWAQIRPTLTVPEA